MEKSPLPDLELTASQAANVLGWAVSTVNRWGDNGRLECSRTDGNHRRYPYSDVIRLRDELKAEEVPS